MACGCLLAIVEDVLPVYYSPAMVAPQVMSFGPRVVFCTMAHDGLYMSVHASLLQPCFRDVSGEHCRAHVRMCLPCACCGFIVSIALWRVAALLAIVEHVLPGY
jgi:hypothetical protein